jgi:hypothetical protein
LPLPLLKFNVPPAGTIVFPVPLIVPPVQFNTPVIVTSPAPDSVPNKFRLLTVDAALNVEVPFPFRLLMVVATENVTVPLITNVPVVAIARGALIE